MPEKKSLLTYKFTIISIKVSTGIFKKINNILKCPREKKSIPIKLEKDQRYLSHIRT